MLHNTREQQEPKGFTEELDGLEQEERVSNYEIMKRQMQKEFLNYNQEEMIAKFQLRYDSMYLYLHFIGHLYRINRKNGIVEWAEDDMFCKVVEAGYNEAMTLYDVLCNSKPDCHLAGQFVNMESLSSIQGSSTGVGSRMFRKVEEFFDHKEEELQRACERLHGFAIGKGDVAYELPVFNFLPVRVQFWSSDEDFDASLQLFTDQNILQYMHYETVWFAMSHLMTRLQEEMSREITETCCG